MIYEAIVTECYYLKFHSTACNDFCNSSPVCLASIALHFPVSKFTTQLIQKVHAKLLQLEFLRIFFFS